MTTVKTLPPLPPPPEVSCKKNHKILSKKPTVVTDGTCFMVFFQTKGSKHDSCKTIRSVRSKIT